MGGRLRDGEAFDRLVEEHYDDVLAYCRRHAPSYDEAPDVAQEAFLRFVRSGRSPIEGKPLAYLLTIARNLCIDASRAKRPPAVPLDVDVPDRSPGADPAAACAGSEVGGLIGALDPELREVVELRFDQGFKVGEIAQVLGVSRFAVNRRLNRALAELRRGLEGRSGA
ncbi:MAG: sigma-70 family RNA polymerase sigma factor [Gordonibacter pamelaeae]|uniref:Sigma-70 family RNA polymerase sigma factor n=2 Tax=Gordonibacter pamelaeae TaxID=471189 RepID=A0A369M814_9ACTN|nr:sigma-70 family RNA polymerase sigma factor [Gordonibacter pamelaeae]MBS4895611.1 sigma-70 family RNA polymerase sigma factor [Gordonibacter pamelaeae]RDB66558.1 sigma-70 family RNA polymerase sigma factor [Gordonibacter pamelaeae]HJH72354.1 sigma-70 family RNA polymerase sigma factor [Eggerthellaceae bacterium]